MELRIGNTILENNVILAPMAGVTDLPFRLLCREQGAGCVVTEMVSAKAILYNNRNTKELMQIHPQERPAAIQLFGSDPDIMAQIAARIEDGPYDFIDVNMGCPVPKVVNNGEGSALMKNPKQAEKVLSAMVKAVKKPVTVKFRKGFNDTSVNAVEFAKMAEGSGCPWQDKGTVLFRKGGLGYHTPGKGGGEDSGDWERGHLHASGCRAHDGGNWLRWNHGGQGSEGESVDFQAHQPLPGHGGNPSRTFYRRDTGNDPASRTYAGSVQG